MKFFIFWQSEYSVDDRESFDWVSLKDQRPKKIRPSKWTHRMLNSIHLHGNICHIYSSNCAKIIQIVCKKCPLFSTLRMRARLPWMCYKALVFMHWSIIFSDVEFEFCSTCDLRYFLQRSKSPKTFWSKRNSPKYTCVWRQVIHKSCV